MQYLDIYRLFYIQFKNSLICWLIEKIIGD